MKIFNMILLVFLEIMFSIFSIISDKRDFKMVMQQLVGECAIAICILCSLD